MELEIIARVHTDFPTKFGLPRQSGLAALPAEIVFEPPFRDASCIRGIGAWSHLWLIWQFDRAVASGWAPTVAPPKLGGRERVGVFATGRPSGPISWGFPASGWSKWRSIRPEGRCSMFPAQIWRTGRPSSTSSPICPMRTAFPARQTPLQTSGAAGFCRWTSRTNGWR